MAQIQFSTPNLAKNSPPEFQFLIYNVAKPRNVGNMIRSAVAMGATTAVVVGSRKLQAFGALASESYLTYNHFETIKEAHASLKERGFEIVGIEIDNQATSIVEPNKAFRGPTCFMLGEEGHGMRPEHRKFCDRFIYIPQFGHGTASLNVSNAAAIVFYAFASWAQYVQSPIEGEKFLVDKSQSYSKYNVTRDADGQVVLNEEQLKIRESRAIKKQRQQEDTETAADNQQVSLHEEQECDVENNA